MEETMQFEQIAYEVKGSTAIVTLNRPEKRNALSGRLLRELNAALAEADEHNAVHCVVLRGAGPHFCAGADLSEYSSGRGPEYRGRQEIDDDVWRLEQGQRLRVMLFDMHKPVIAQVHGSCIGIGTGLDVAVPLWPAMGEAAAADRRLPERQGRRAHRPGAEILPRRAAADRGDE